MLKLAAPCTGETKEFLPLDGKEGAVTSPKSVVDGGWVLMRLYYAIANDQGNGGGFQVSVCENLPGRRLREATCMI